MRKFWGFYKNESYSVGCNGATVYIYDSNGKELAKFKDFPYAYTAAFKPNTNIVAVKSTVGFLGFYDLDSLSLIKKITVTRIGAQDEGFAFTPDGRHFYNIEKPVHSYRTQLGIYDAESFEKVSTLFANERKMVLNNLEFDNETGIGYVLGFMRGDADGVFDYGFVGKLDVKNGSVTDLHALDKEQYDYLYWYKSWEKKGFTEKSLKWNPLNKRHCIKEISIKAVFDAANSLISGGQRNPVSGGDPMLEHMPTQSALAELLGQSLFEVWGELCAAVEEKYDMERLWNTGGKNWTYEYKYRRGGKTLCALYARESCVGFMIVFGKDEREKFEEIRDTLSDSVCRRYDEAIPYRDGKWVMFEPADASEFDDYMKLLAVKRKPNRK